MFVMAVSYLNRVRRGSGLWSCVLYFFYLCVRRTCVSKKCTQLLYSLKPRRSLELSFMKSINLSSARHVHRLLYLFAIRIRHRKGCSFKNKRFNDLHSLYLETLRGFISLVSAGTGTSTCMRWTLFQWWCMWWYRGCREREYCGGFWWLKRMRGVYWDCCCYCACMSLSWRPYTPLHRDCYRWRPYVEMIENIFYTSL